MRKVGLALLMAGLAGGVQAAGPPALPVVKPVLACQRLASARLGRGELTDVTLDTAAVIASAQGPFCKVTGGIGPGTVKFEVWLPIERWTQRFAQAAQNVLTIPRAGANRPALNGELALAINDKGGPGISRGTLWTSENQQKRIDWAYRANHITSLAAKALIKAFYGQTQRFAYFLGCSMGGREALAEVQRYPQDFDGVVAGAPVVVDSVHNAFYPGWEWAANRRMDGSIILTADRLPILHAAAIRHCAARSGLIDGMLQHAAACTFDPAWVTCAKGQTDRTTCLTSEEARVAQKLYTGPTDREGRLLDAGGFPLGSELSWRLSTPAGPANEATDPGNALVRLLAPTDRAQDQAMMSRTFAFDNAWFRRTAAMAPLWNTANTNLRPFQRGGGKLILWIGGSDQTVQPASTIAYYRGIQQTMGAAATDRFARFFLLPGVNHCGGGEGPNQIDVVSAIMNWTEQGKAPAMLVADKVERRRSDPALPYSEAAAPALYSRPIYPWPQVARYGGKGDPRSAASYRQAPPTGPTGQPLPPEMAQFFGPDNQRWYEVIDSRLQPVARRVDR
ncbi:tannase/feruloyl esterase family alpha/beta hydrolase [Novosphingobium flavum]|uniref:Tannase/feruloyl esterase family alpha/beta hydrolase n=1 Tax=Novosphingobium flavum TaxID=1778672 RepID=A0A7X1FSF5_9SPHN|nr:tannase/feruloyl esterase family alpha/beta hydrolase [Novosphingobium flavum]MBC2666115.1 tannase/feruloyl esterase family alpha/beta hydrolase [Novosphingobium flavum]